ncbi:MAG: bifunctional adenosylcobinamide kinase/adenosylcobinamide-phosphate guanylyltransferase [Nitrospinota bacterium]|nr:bifunctional adenosylcobinamide kinase/adenosylcobinamide-phosphate guanylyltransferase [Nitrospinota bacterium]
MGKLTLILGGSNSGKSNFAENLLNNHKDVLYLATAEAIDDEMKMKLKKHRESRPQEWKTIEEPVHIDKVIEKEDHNFSAVLVECILLCVNNIIIKNSLLTNDDAEKMVLDKMVNMAEEIKNTKSDCYIVSGEVGLGLIGENKSARLYGRVLGQVNQWLAENAADIFFVVAGIPTKIK